MTEIETLIAKPFAEWTDADLSECAQWWAEELGLGAWDVRAVFVPRHELDGGNAANSFNGAYEYMKIRVSEWRSFSVDEQPSPDLECSVVHEILHARFWACDVASSDTAQSYAHEAAIDRTARALVRQRRGA